MKKHQIILIILISFIFVFGIATIIVAKHLPETDEHFPLERFPFKSGWTDDGAVVRLTTGTDNVGIGTDTPIAKVDINGKIKISDGTEVEGKVLTSDATGLASWQEQPTGDGVIGNGTPDFIPLWTTSSSLGDSIMKIGANGDLILKPGVSIIVISADGSNCWKFSGEGLKKLTPNCPSF